LVIVSNRLPVVLSRDNAGDWQLKAGSGGLVTALAPVLRNRGGVWIGWTGTDDTDGVEEIKQLISDTTKGMGYTFKPVMLTREDVEQFYYGFANEIIWPLFHDLQTRCNFEPGYWKAYEKVNRKYAEVIAQNVKNDDHIWIHDYHLMTVARKLRKIGVNLKIGFFLHIPFPPLDMFLRLPWRIEILQSLLEYDLVGFQTHRDRRNFIQCIRTLFKEISIRGKGQVLTIHVGERKVRIGNFPISIDYQEFSQRAAKKEIADRAMKIHSDLTARYIVLGVDRLDYTKGIPERLAAFGNALERFPELRQKMSFLQIVVPSREAIPKYQDLKSDIEHRVSEINGRFTQPGWIPIHYIFRSINRDELLAFYRAAEIALITPLKDGMNLVAKEYCAANVDETGVLILSEFAGAAPQLQGGALLVNPYDMERVAETLHHASRMDLSQRQRRMRYLRRTIRRYDIYWWVDSFLKAAFARDLKYFKQLEDHVVESQTAMHDMNWKNIGR
jgi:trehalose 6-phosphate synthase